MSTNENKPNKPRDFSMKIRSTTETAFQRAIWGSKTSKVGRTTVTWIDIELPVNQSGNPRGRCIDLIGIDDQKEYVICELKFGKNTKDAPAKAAKQVNEYLKFIQDNRNSLQPPHKKARLPIDWRKVAAKSTRKIVAANKDYWNHWSDPKRNKDKKSTTSIPDGIECYTLDISTKLFAEQKKKSKEATYTPEITEERNIWTPVDL